VPAGKLIPRQLRRAQARQGAPLADPASALDLPLHPHLVLLAERGRDLFAKLAKRQLKRGVLPSVVALREAINGFVAARNRDPRPFVWKADPKAIIAAAKREHQASESIHKEQIAGEGPLREDH
jgi:hypothetical protein